MVREQEDGGVLSALTLTPTLTLTLTLTVVGEQEDGGVLAVRAAQSEEVRGQVGVQVAHRLEEG